MKIVTRDGGEIMTVVQRMNMREIEERLECLRQKVKEVDHVSIDGQGIVLFISIGNPAMRAKVIQVQDSTFDRVWRKLQKQVMNYIDKTYSDPIWMKIDIVSSIETLRFEQLESMIAKTKRNYFRQGIAFDKEFRLAFLEQELNGYALIRKLPTEQFGLDPGNINNYIRYKHGDKFPFLKERYAGKKVYMFKTKAFFDDNSQLYELYDGERTNGIRKTDNIKQELHTLIEQSTKFLMGEILEDGKFEYGYFPCFARRIPTYNILRHCSTLYAMGEAYEYLGDENIRQSIEKSLQYVIDQAIIYKDDMAFVVDEANHNEIKLGSQAHAILALTKLMQVTQNDDYLQLAQQLGRAIIWMQQENGGFAHVYEAPEITLKEQFRTVYYDGEAVFALLRLYALNPEKQWLDAVEHAFDFLIENDYWKYSDHWLSYASNEIVMYKPEDRYFIFGLKNCQRRLEFIYHRNTTYPTFLELTMAVFKMVRKIEELGKDYLFSYIDREFLLETIDRRAEYQRVGFYYPEMAMYFKKPEQILHGFFIRHQAFRVRIDDIEHNLSGYIHYLLYRVPELKSLDLTIQDV